MKKHVILSASIAFIFVFISFVGLSQFQKSFTYSDTVNWEGKMFAQDDVIGKIHSKETGEVRIVFNKDFEFTVNEENKVKLIEVLNGYLLAELDLNELQELGKVNASLVQAASRTKDSTDPNKYSMTWGKNVDVRILYNGNDLCIEFPEIESGVEPRIVKSLVHRFWVKGENIEDLISTLR